MRQKELRSWKKVFESDLPHIAFELREFIESPALIILDGKMGMGKTAFSKAFLEESTMSPTYSVVTEVGKSVHADFYRIKSREEILHLELPLYLEGKEFFLVEWGREFYSQILSELPESFEHYLLLIDESSQQQGQESRNFTLFSISDD